MSLYVVEDELGTGFSGGTSKPFCRHVQLDRCLKSDKSGEPDSSIHLFHAAIRVESHLLYGSTVDLCSIDRNHQLSTCRLVCLKSIRLVPIQQKERLDYLDLLRLKN